MVFNQWQNKKPYILECHVQLIDRLFVIIRITMELGVY